jgi:surfeit locus 1 family protein
VMTPLKIDGGDLCILVDRGWVAAGSSRAVLPQVGTPPGEQMLEGIAVRPPRFFEFGNATPAGPVWQNVTIERFQAATGLALQPFLMRQTSAAADGLTHIDERPDTGVNMHRGYAFQWFTFATLVVILYIALNFKRADNGEEKSSKQQTQ